MSEKKRTATTLDESDIQGTRVGRRSALRLVGAGVASVTVLSAGLVSGNEAQAQGCSDSDPHDPAGYGRSCGHHQHGDPVGHGRACSDSDPHDPGGHGHNCSDHDHG